MHGVQRCLPTAGHLGYEIRLWLPEEPQPDPHYACHESCTTPPLQSEQTAAGEVNLCGLTFSCQAAVRSVWTLPSATVWKLMPPWDTLCAYFRRHQKQRAYLSHLRDNGGGGQGGVKKNKRKVKKKIVVLDFWAKGYREIWFQNRDRPFEEGPVGELWKSVLPTGHVKASFPVWFEGTFKYQQRHFWRFHLPLYLI